MTYLRTRTRALRRRLRPENRVRTVRAPLAHVALALDGLRVGRGRRTRRLGVSRLSSICVINLANRPDRLQAFMDDAARLELDNVQRIEAVRAENGSAGCAWSHAVCMEQMLEQSWPAMMVCEDDALFRVGRRSLDVLVERFLNDPAAEVACLAYFHRQASPHNRLYLRTTDTQTTACYLIKESIAPAMLEISQESATQLEAGGDLTAWSLDQVWKKLQRERTFLIPIVRAATQRPGYSDISSQPVAYRV